MSHLTTHLFAVSPTLDRVCFNFAVDPVDVIGDACVDPGLILMAAPVAPADHAHQSHPVLGLTHQGAARVSLWGKLEKNPHE